MNYPGGRRFAFTILDDTDDATLENVRPIYERLREDGFRTTKTAWPLDCPEGSRLFFAGETLQRPAYLKFVHELVNDGFELAAHGATMESSTRERTARGIEFFLAEFGAHPRVYANHGFNRESIYWGPGRFASPGISTLAKYLQRSTQFSGEDPKSPYFWGDLCSERIEYVRNFTFRQLDMQLVNPRMPYHVTSMPFVRYWFSSTSAADRGEFVQRVTPSAIDRLERAGGVCILSTHFGKGFSSRGIIDPAIDRLLKNISERPGWFAPVSTVLDHLRTQRVDHVLGTAALSRLEGRFLLDQVVDRLDRRRRNRHPES